METIFTMEFDIFLENYICRCQPVFSASYVSVNVYEQIQRAGYSVGSATKVCILFCIDVLSTNSEGARFLPVGMTISCAGSPHSRITFSVGILEVISKYIDIRGYTSGETCTPNSVTSTCIVDVVEFIGQTLVSAVETSKECFRFAVFFIQFCIVLSIETAIAEVQCQFISAIVSNGAIKFIIVVDAGLANVKILTPRVTPSLSAS